MTSHTKTILGIAGSALALFCAPASSSAQTLIDRWTFNESSGATAANSVAGGVSATLMGGATFDGTGRTVLNGTGGTFVNLGGGLLTGLSSVTFEGWFSYSVPNNNVHLFAFDDGKGTGTENGGAWNGNYLRYNVYDSGHAGGLSWVEIPNLGNPNGGVLNGTTVLPQNSLLHVAVVYDPANSIESLYINGAFQSSVTGTLAPISSIFESRATLGASPWSAWGDPYLTGTIDQFDIYNGVRSAEQISADFVSGPVAVPEPSSAVLGLAGAFLLGLYRRSRAS